MDPETTDHRLIVVYGGSASGKSAFAEKMTDEIAADCGATRIYLATMKPWGAEAEARVARHQAQRAQYGFATCECYGRLSSIPADEIPDGSVVLLECMGNVMANLLFDESVSTDFEADDAVDINTAAPLDPDDIVAATLADIDQLAARTAALVIVANDIGADGVEYGPDTEIYRRALGATQCALANRADTVVEVVSGCARIIKGRCECS